MALQSRLPVLLGRHSNTKQANQIVLFVRLFLLMDIGHLVTEDCANRPKRHLIKKTPLIDYQWGYLLRVGKANLAALNLASPHLQDSLMLAM